MSPATFDVEEAGGVRMVVVHGDVDISTAPGLKDAIVGENGESPSAVTVDLTDCRYMDSSGLTALISGSRKLGPNLRVVLQEDSFLRKLFKITGLDSHFALHAAPEQARRAHEAGPEPPTG